LAFYSGGGGGIGGVFVTMAVCGSAWLSVFIGAYSGVKGVFWR